MPVEERREMGRAAREDAMARFDREAIVTQWERLYRELLAAVL